MSGLLRNSRDILEKVLRISKRGVIAVVKCAECGQDFESTRVLGSHVLYQHRKLAPCIELPEEAVDKMAQMLQEAEGQIQADLSSKGMGYIPY